MRLSLLSSDGIVCRVVCSGDMTLLDLQDDADPLRELFGPGYFRNRVLLNLEQVTYMDTGIVGWLMQCHQRFLDSGGRLILHSVPPRVDQLFQLLRLRSVLHVTDDESAALKLAGG
jgi:anti-anti-sigma factor